MSTIFFLDHDCFVSKTDTVLHPCRHFADFSAWCERQTRVRGVPPSQDFAQGWVADMGNMVRMELDAEFDLNSRHQSTRVVLSFSTVSFAVIHRDFLYKYEQDRAK